MFTTAIFFFLALKPSEGLCKDDDSIDFGAHDPGWSNYAGCKELVNEGVSGQGYSIAWSVTQAGESVEFFLESWGGVRWMAVGINEHGGMEGLDAIIVRKDEAGNAIAEDRYAEAQGKPELDKGSNGRVELLGFWEDDADDGRTRAWVRRAASVCDDKEGNSIHISAVDPYLLGLGTEGKHDVAVPNSVLWSYGASDSFTYHSHRRGVFIAHFTTPPSAKHSDTFSSLRITFPNIPLSSETRNDYHCIVQELDQSPTGVFGEEERISLVKQVVSPGPYLHHIIMLGCANNPWSPSTLKHGCVNVPFELCRELVYLNGYAQGAELSEAFPGTGYNFGRNIKYLILQTHFYNPELKPDVVDGASTVSLTFSKPQARNLGTFLVGPMRFQLDPDTLPGHSAQMICNCDGEEFGQAPEEWSFGQSLEADKRVMVMGVFHHMHRMGKTIHTFVLRENKRITLHYTKAYNYNQQGKKFKRFELLPGDKIGIQCTYDLSGHGWRKAGEPTVVNYGDGVDDEMCFSFVELVNARDFFICAGFAGLQGFDASTFSKTEEGNRNFCPKAGFKEVRYPTIPAEKRKENKTGVHPIFSSPDYEGGELKCAPGTDTGGDTATGTDTGGETTTVADTASASSFYVFYFIILLW